MAEGTTAIDTALTTEGDADGTDLIEFGVGAGDYTSDGPLQYIKTHEEIAARKLAPPFWGKPFIAALLSAFIREIQTLEDTVWEFIELRTLPLADLPRLKVLGKIGGQPRLSFATEEYRTVIRARALANVSRGRASDILAVLEVLVGTGDYVLTEGGNATLLITVLIPIGAAELMRLRVVLPDVRAAGVGMSLLSVSASPSDMFRWGDPWNTKVWASRTVL